MNESVNFNKLQVLLLKNSNPSNFVKLSICPIEIIDKKIMIKQRLIAAPAKGRAGEVVEEGQHWNGS